MATRSPSSTRPSPRNAPRPAAPAARAAAPFRATPGQPAIEVEFDPLHPEPVEAAPGGQTLSLEVEVDLTSLTGPPDAAPAPPEALRSGGRARSRQHSRVTQPDLPAVSSEPLRSERLDAGPKITAIRQRRTGSAAADTRVDSTRVDSTRVDSQRVDSQRVVGIDALADALGAAPLEPAVAVVRPRPQPEPAPAPEIEVQAPDSAIAPIHESGLPVIEAPAPEIEAPAPEIEAPAPEIEAPAPEIEAPAPDSAVAPIHESGLPAIEVQAPAIEAQAPIEVQAPAIEAQAPDIEVLPPIEEQARIVPERIERTVMQAAELGVRLGTWLRHTFGGRR